MNVVAFCLYWKLMSSEIPDIKWCKKVISEWALLQAYILAQALKMGNCSCKETCCIKTSLRLDAGLAV